jgi:hypothetical protein
MGYGQEQSETKNPFLFPVGNNQLTSITIVANVTLGSLVTNNPGFNTAYNSGRQVPTQGPTPRVRRGRGGKKVTDTVE